ncbi:MAG: FAD binding domain-containing protein [Oligoflexia bacterium]|nr:FAD binding domain-containing protein [Oligoflexia bacterium]
MQKEEQRRNYLLLYINGVRIEVRGEAVMRPLSDFLREELRLTGTKIVCAEGDCGACTVMVIAGDKIRIVNSCIAPLYLFDCQHLVTVEGLTVNGELNPVQQALVTHHGTQCGFCTPGFVVALTALVANRQRARTINEFQPQQELVQQELVQQELGGNLCRCTGYQGIIDAAKSIDIESIPFVLAHLLHPEIERDLQLHRTTELLIEQEQHQQQDQQRRLFAPTTLAAALAFLADSSSEGGAGPCLVVAGASDLGVQFNKRKRTLPSRILSLSAISDPKLCTVAITVAEGGGRQLVIGGKVTLAQWRDAMQEMPELQQIPELFEINNFLQYFASPQIRTVATLAGNIANASPIGDTLPLLLVTDSRLELQSVRGSRIVALKEYFLGYRQSVLAKDELITRIFIPLLPLRPSLALPQQLGWRLRLYKISRRKNLDISTVSVAFMAHFSDDWSTILEIRVGLGGVAATPVRVPLVEDFLRNKCYGEWGEKEWEELGKVLQKAITPISDLRADAAYRMQIVLNHFKKFFLECNLECNRRDNE